MQKTALKYVSFHKNSYKKKLADKVALRVGSMRTQSASIGRRTTNHT